MTETQFERFNQLVSTIEEPAFVAFTSSKDPLSHAAFFLNFVERIQGNPLPFGHSTFELQLQGFKVCNTDPILAAKLAEHFVNALATTKNAIATSGIRG